MKIKRLITGGAAALLTGATLVMGGLAATSFSDGMGALVEITDSTYSSPLIVVGPTAGVQDVIGATDIAASLVSNYAVEEKTTPGATGTTGVTGGVLIDSDLNKTYIGSGTNYISLVRSVFTQTDLPDLLATQSFTDMNATTSSYTQKIVPANAAPMFSVPSGETEPVLHVPISTTTNPYNLTVTFIGGLDPTAVDTTYGLTLFGKQYTFGNTHTNISIELYSAAGAQVLTLSGSGAEETVSVGDQTFTIKLNGWNTAGTTAYISVNDVSYTWNEAGTYTVNAVKFYVQSVDVIYTGAQDATGLVKLFVGTDKLTLNNGQQIQKNDVSKETYVYINSPSATKINSITFQVYPDNDAIIAAGVDFDDPIFGSFKTVVSDMTPGMTDTSRDNVVIKSDSSNVKLTFTNKDGMAYTNIPVGYGNSTAMYQQINNIYKFHTAECNVSAGTGNITKGEYFALSRGEYSYIFKYTSYNYDTTDDTKTYVTLTELSTGTAYKVYPDVVDGTGVGEKLTVGANEFPVQWNGNTVKNVCVDFNGDGDYDEDIVNLTTGGNGIIQFAGGENITYYETPLYTVSGSNDPSGTQIKTQASYSSTSGVRFIVTPAVLQVGTNNEWKYGSNYGSYVYVTGDNNGKNNVEIYSPGQRPAPANIAIGLNPVVSTSAGTSGGTYNEAVPITNAVAKFANEITADATLDKNLVLIGGPCANDLVKTLLDAAWETEDSCSYWLNDHEVLKNAGNGLAKVVDDVFSSGKKALILAGTTADDTRNLIANKIIKPTVYT
ncbi:MAG: S-layer protein, partial [Candidatus Peribacteraceae bacterium]|nr:S-layer protein [Candidatus Peribacteraceae bacterium]